MLQIERRSRKGILIAIVVTALVVAVGGWLMRSAQSSVAPLPGKLAPDFTLPVAGGGEVSLSHLRGNPVVLNFWATWCPPCRREMPHLNRLYNEYKGMGLRLYGVNLQESEQVVQEFSEAYSLNFPMLLDMRAEVSDLYLIHAIPVTVFIDAEGRVQNTYTGEMPPDLMERFFQALVEGRSGVR